VHRPGCLGWHRWRPRLEKAITREAKENQTANINLELQFVDRDYTTRAFEYRPLREFATNQALTFAVELGWGVEFPNQVRYVSKLTLPPASGPVPDLAPGWQIYLRIHFDARYDF